MSIPKPYGLLNYIVFEFITIPLGQNGLRQDDMVWKKILFSNLLINSRRGFGISQQNSLLSWAFSRQDEKIKLNGIINGSVTFK